MEEKKLTDDTEINVGMMDEEIVKDIEHSTGMPSYWKKTVLDLIHRQKAEIERLTEENEHLDGCAKQFLADYQKCEIANVELQELNAKYYNEAKDLRRENVELQKQVDELKIKTCPNADYCGGRIQQAVKDTAKEILIPLVETEKQIDPLKTGIRWSVLKGFCKRYGVEVE